MKNIATRRQFFTYGAQLVGAMSLGKVLAACGGDSATSPDAAASSDGATSTADAPAGSSWASGGTAAMTGKATYPDPFTAALTSCLVVAGTTEGPCTTATDLVRQDISEANPGLPVRLALKIVDADCQPLAGAVVKIWHTNAEGSYSGQTPNNGMCLKQASYASIDFFRGAQTTDANGVVYFDTCFPGWYRGRCVHIHFQVKQNGVSSKVSQVFFPQDVTTQIFASHPTYSSYGQPDTSLANDNIVSGIPATSRANHIFEVARMTDGAMLASKVIAVVS